MKKQNNIKLITMWLLYVPRGSHATIYLKHSFVQQIFHELFDVVTLRDCRTIHVTCTSHAVRWKIVEYKSCMVQKANMACEIFVVIFISFSFFFYYGGKTGTSHSLVAFSLRFRCRERRAKINERELMRFKRRLIAGARYKVACHASLNDPALRFSTRNILR